MFIGSRIGVNIKYDHRWFIGGVGIFLRLHGPTKVEVGKFSSLEMVAFTEYI